MFTITSEVMYFECYASFAVHEHMIIASLGIFFSILKRDLKIKIINLQYKRIDRQC